ncbi:MAG TPA: SLATT domain-containing protein [Candidatus Angelobacter sp.]|jgi:hypothetical protein|nr:SLATT domain-containing protein [Candidatus Angelobacter sp.]
MDESSSVGVREPHNDLALLLERWLGRARESQRGHYEAATRLENLNHWLGIPVVVMTTVVGTSVFASLQRQMDLHWQVLVGLISVLAAVLAGLQTFLRFSEKAEKHRAAGAAYGAIRREIEMILAVPPADRNSKELLDGLRIRIDTLAKEAPEIPARVWRSQLPKSE